MIHYRRHIVKGLKSSAGGIILTVEDGPSVGIQMADTKITSGRTYLVVSCADLGEQDDDDKDRVIRSILLWSGSRDQAIEWTVGLSESDAVRIATVDPVRRLR